MKPRRWILVLASGALFLIALLAYGVVAPIEIGQEISDGSTVSISSGLEAGQVFTAHFPGLTEVSVQAAHIPEDGLAYLQFRLTTYDEGDERTLLSTEDVHFTQRSDWLQVRFPRLPYDAPHVYAFYLTSGSNQPIELKGNLENLYPEGTRLGGGGDLVFRARFHPPAGQTLTILATRLASHKPGLLGNPWTYLLLLIALFASLVGTTHQLVLASTGDAIMPDPPPSSTSEP